MEAIAKKSLETTSAIAIERATSQKVSAVVIPFPAPESREEVAANSIAVGEALADAIRETVEADNDNAVEGLPTRNALIERQHLATAFDIVSNVIEGRNHIPVLDNARVTASGDMATITATDLDIEIAVTVPAAIDAGFDVTIPSKKMKELLKGAPKADYVAFENDGERVAADFEKVRYRLNSIPAAYFPVLKGPENGAYFMMRGADIAGGLEAVSGAISTEETRYYLNGIFFERVDTSEGRELRMVATDGHRLYTQKLELPGVIGQWPAMGYQNGVIIPRKTVALLSKLMRGKKCPTFINITVSDTSCRFVFSYEFGTVTITSKNIDGTFPDYRRVIPSYSNFPAARFDSEAMAEGIKAVSLISAEKGRAFKLAVNSTGADLTVNSPENGSAHAPVECQWESEAVEIGFNARYMLDALDVAGDGEASIYIQDASSPGVVIGQREGWLAVVMPMRV